MTEKQYRNLLIESTVSGIGKIDIYKSPADKIVNSIKTGNADDVAANSSRCACDAIAVLGRIYDAQDEDRPMITENDEENEAQGDSEISVDLPDSTDAPEVQNISDVIDDNKGVPVGNEEVQKPEETIADEDGGLEESFILEDDEDPDGSDLPEDEPEEDETSDDDTEASDDSVAGADVSDQIDETCNEDDEELPEDEEELPEDEPEVVDDGEGLPEDEEELPEDEDEELPEDVVVDEEDEGLPEDEEGLPEDEPEVSDDDTELPEDELGEDGDEELPEDVATEDVDDSELPEDEQTGSDTILGDGTGEVIPAKPIEKDGEVYEAAEDPALDPNAAAEAPAVPADPNAAPADPNAVPPEGEVAPAEDPAAAGGDPNAVPPEGEAPAEDPAADPNAEQDPVLDIDSQVVATDTTQESVLESLLREMKSSDEGYMDYEAEDFEPED